MTLLELLHQELPKRGGWPEGVTAMFQDWDGEVRFRGKSGSIWLTTISDNHRRDYQMEKPDYEHCVVTREQYEATGWDGTGLPPVGVKVEVNSPRHGWTQATVTAVTGSWIIAKYPDGAEYAGCHRCLNDDGSWTDNPGIFRPLRTEAERAIDEMVQLSGVSNGAAKILYDAGYRK